MRGCRGQGAHELGRERPAFQEHDPAGSAVGTISNERTFREDVRDPACIESDAVRAGASGSLSSAKARRQARTVSLKLRYADFQTLQRSRSITPTCSELELYPAIRDLFDRARTRRTAIRLLGICLSNLRPSGEQLSLFDHTEPLHRAVDGVRARFGYDALRLALGDPDREE